MTAETITPNDDATALSDRALLERIARQLDHLDQMIHDNGQLLDEVRPLVPLIPRALALLDPGAAMRRNWKRGGKSAVPQRTATPLHVGETSEDRGQVGA